MVVNEEHIVDIREGWIMNKRYIVGLLILTAIFLSGCVTKKTIETRIYSRHVPKHTTHIDRVEVDRPKKVKLKRVTYGKASWYGKNLDGKKTASGEIFSSNKRTAAHRTLPFNTMVKVTDMVSNRSEIVRINDRGPFGVNRIIDLSFISAKKLGLVKRGVTDVRLEIVGSNGKVDKCLLSLPTSNKSCVGDNCKATILREDRVVNRVSSWAETTSIEPTTIESVYEEESVVHSLDDVYSSSHSIDVVESDSYISSSVADSLPKIDSYSKKVSIQVGAFRKYSGAEVYLQRYSMLNSQYKAIIKSGDKDAKPIYKVQIEGFETESEARRFISKYKHTLNGAFLVRR